MKKLTVFTLIFLFLSATSLNIGSSLKLKNHLKKITKNRTKTNFFLRNSIVKKEEQNISNPIAKSFFSDYQLDVTKGMEQEYWLAIKSIDQQTNYHQLNGFDQFRLQSQLNNGFKDRILQDFIQTKIIDRPIKSVQRNNEQVRIFSKQVQQVTAKQAIETSISHGNFDVKVGSKANVWGRNCQAWVQSNVVNLEANVQFQDSELYRLVANKEITISEKLPKIKSSVYYGGSSGNIGATVNSQIVDNIQWTVQSNFPKDNKAEHTLSFNYGISL